MPIRQLPIFVWLVATLAFAPGVAAADPLPVSGRLSPLTENPTADPDGHGVVALTISADRTQLTYRITYGDVDVPITEVYFCSGFKPREEPIPVVCAFVISPSVGGPSPITGTRSIVSAQADVLASGFAVIQLGSASGSQLAGYVEIGPPPPDTATAAVVGSPVVGALLPVLAGFITLVVVLTGLTRRRPDPGPATW